VTNDQRLTLDHILGDNKPAPVSEAPVEEVADAEAVVEAAPEAAADVQAEASE